MIIDIIKEHSGHSILIGLDLIGKEELLVAIAKHFNTKVEIITILSHNMI
jgi:hypothetical protein